MTVLRSHEQLFLAYLTGSIHREYQHPQLSALTQDKTALGTVAHARPSLIFISDMERCPTATISAPTN
jgi:hypothetical protein